jgi:hypothetical protein
MSLNCLFLLLSGTRCTNNCLLLVTYFSLFYLYLFASVRPICPFSVIILYNIPGL